MQLSSADSDKLVTQLTTGTSFVAACAEKFGIRQDFDASHLLKSVYFIDPEQQTCETLSSLPASGKGTAFKDMAVTLHIGDTFDQEVWERYYYNLLSSGLSFDVYCNVRTFVLASQVAKVFREHLKVTVQLENRGMDIGGFFLALLALRQGNTRYGSIFKVHAKQDLFWRQELLDPLIGSPEAINKVVDILRSESIGQVFALRREVDAEAIFPERLFIAYALGDVLNFGLTAYWQDALLKELNISLPLAKRFFMAGTMLAFKGAMLQSIFDDVDLYNLYTQLCTPTSFDTNWHGIMSRHYASSGEDETSLPVRVANSLSRHHQSGSLSDGQIEHAWERVICYLAPATGYESVALVAEHVHTFKEASIDMLLGNIERARKGFWWRYFDFNECMSGNDDTGACVVKATAGECFIQPQMMRGTCDRSCRCLHGSSAYPDRADIPRQFDVLKTVHRSRVNGVYFSGALAYGHLLHCLGYTPEGDPDLNGMVETIFTPVSLSIGWSVPMCTRFMSKNGNQLFLGVDGLLRLHDAKFQSQWIVGKADDFMVSEHVHHLEMMVDEHDNDIGFLRVTTSPNYKKDDTQVPGWPLRRTLWQSESFSLHNSQDFRLEVDDEVLCFKILSVPAGRAVFSQCV